MTNTTYDLLLSDILLTGQRQETRSGIDRLYLIGQQVIYDVSKNVPLITGRKLNHKPIIAELLWYLSGSTRLQDLQALGCHYWDSWGNTDLEENRNFYARTGYPDGFLGPIYGWQLRHFGGNYSKYVRMNGRKFDTAEGFDQIPWLLSKIVQQPWSSKLVVSYWNPRDMELMRLEPCVYSFQIIIDEDTEKMSLVLNQRSCDVPVGGAANIFMYTVLLYLIALHTNYRPGFLIHNIGNAHIYLNQIEPIKKYLSAKKTPYPSLTIDKKPSIFDYAVDDFNLLNYAPTTTIKIPVVV